MAYDADGLLQWAQDPNHADEPAGAATCDGPKDARDYRTERAFPWDEATRRLAGFRDLTWDEAVKRWRRTQAGGRRPKTSAS